jgi:hypothetical protein
MSREVNVNLLHHHQHHFLEQIRDLTQLLLLLLLLVLGGNCYQGLPALLLLLLVEVGLGFQLQHCPSLGQILQG